MDVCVHRAGAEGGGAWVREESAAEGEEEGAWEHSGGLVGVWVDSGGGDVGGWMGRW